LRNIPHFLRLRDIERLIRENKDGEVYRYADLGCSNGFLTDRIGKILKADHIVGYDHNCENLFYAANQYSDITFLFTNFNEKDTLKEKFDFITCFETLEHVGEPRITVQNIIHALNENGTAIISVPIEIGVRGLFKLIIKTFVYKYSMKELPNGSAIFGRYLRALLTGERISRFRDKRYGWGTHFGFDYRDIDEALKEEGIEYTAKNSGFTRFYIVRKTQ
jgi:2-polyprenyl-3-methyl-5-hydroxy-6-metoxy-1,4-benzoquinol methylase